MEIIVISEMFIDKEPVTIGVAPVAFVILTLIATVNWWKDAIVVKPAKMEIV